MPKTYSSIPAQDETLIPVSCTVCGGNRFRKHWTISGAEFVKCRTCGLIMQNPQPVQDALAGRYGEDYFAYELANEESFFRLMMLGLKDARFFESIALSLPDPKRILDIGCATGRLLRHFREMNWETAGVELCAESAEYGNREYGVGIVNSTLDSAGFPDRSFSVVHASHLIEHVSDPARFVRTVHRLLVPGGVFICVTPASDGFQARLFGSAWRSAIADHITLFDKRTLRLLLTSAGFRVESVHTWGGIAKGIVGGVIKRLLDSWAKSSGFGDVVLMVARHTG